MWRTFIRRHSYQSKVAPNREGARLIIRRLQKTVLRILRDPDFRMSNPSAFEQKKSEPEPPVDGMQYTAHRQNKQDSNCRTCNDFKSWSKQQRLISNTQAAKVSQLNKFALCTRNVSHNTHLARRNIWLPRNWRLMQLALRCPEMIVHWTRSALAYPPGVCFTLWLRSTQIIQQILKSETCEHFLRYSRDSIHVNTVPRISAQSKLLKSHNSSIVIAISKFIFVSVLKLIPSMWTRKKIWPCGYASFTIGLMVNLGSRSSTAPKWTKDGATVGWMDPVIRFTLLAFFSQYNSATLKKSPQSTPNTGANTVIPCWKTHFASHIVFSSGKRFLEAHQKLV